MIMAVGTLESLARRFSKSSFHMVRNVVFPAPKGAFRLTTRLPSTNSCSTMRKLSTFWLKGFKFSLSWLSKVRLDIDLWVRKTSRLGLIFFVAGGGGNG